jgi:hypothetical protein
LLHDLESGNRTTRSAIEADHIRDRHHQAYLARQAAQQAPTAPKAAGEGPNRAAAPTHARTQQAKAGKP